MPKYPVKSPLKHNGKHYTKGRVEMDKETAAPLIEAGVIGKAASGNEGGKGGKDK